MLLLLPFLLTASPVGSAPAPCTPAWSIVVGPNPTAGTNRLAAVSALSPTRAWAVGYSVDASGNELPLVAHWDGIDWTGGNIAAAAAGKSRLTGVVAIAPTDVVAVGYTVEADGGVVPLVERWNGLVWTASNPAAGTGDHRLFAVAATASGDVTAVGYSTDGHADTTLILHWNGAGWTAAHPNGGTGGDRLAGVAAISASDVVAVGRTDGPVGLKPLVLRWNGSAWSSSNPSAGTGDHELRAVAASGSGDVTAVGVSTTPAGSAPLVLRWGGTSWTAANPRPAGELNGVAAITGGDLWAVGRVADTTLALHWDGSAWSAAPTPNGTGASELAGVASSGSVDPWAVGGDATSTLVEHYGACAPSVATEAATDTTQTTATLHATVNPNGLATDVRFNYGTTTAYGSTTTATTIGAGTADVPVSTAVTGLSPGATYHARVVATSSAGTTTGKDVLFTTASAPTLSLAPTATTVPEGDEGFRTVTLTASLSAASAQTVTVRWATANGTAGAGSDYTPGDNTLTFTPGDLSEAFTVRVLGDDLDEGDEAFTVSLSTPVNASLGSVTSTVTIADDDTKPAVTTDPATSVTQTAAALNGTVGPNGKATTYHFEYGTTTAYGTSTPNTSAGSGTTPQSVAAAVTGLNAGATYHFRLVASSAAGSANGADRSFSTSKPGVSIANTSVTETDAAGTSMTFTVTLSSASTQTVTVAYATGAGSATDPEDYSGRSGTLSFTAGVTTRTIAVPIVGDTLDESDETFTVTLSSPVGAAIADAQATGTIVDNDPPPAVRADNASIPEGDAGTAQVSVTVRLLAPSGRTVTVGYATVDGTATAGSDLTAASGTVTFTPGQTSKAVSVAVAGDAVDEDDETFTLHLSSPVNATIVADGTVTILDNDPQARLTVNDPAVTEGNGAASTVVFTVTLAPASGRTVTVDYATANGTAVAPDDYTARNGTLTFAKGETVKQVSVTVAGDPLYEADETFSLSLSNPANADVLDGTGAATIRNDDARPGFSIGDRTVTEGNSGTTTVTFTVTMCAPGTGGASQPACVVTASGLPASAAYATANGTATAPDDYAAASGNVSIPVGGTTATISTTVVGDALFEPDETFTLSLTGLVGADPARTTATVTIVNDDTQPVLVMGDASTVEGGTLTFTIRVCARGTGGDGEPTCVSQPTGQPLSVNYSASPGTACGASPPAFASLDFQAIGGQRSFLPGDSTSTFVVHTIGDRVKEPDKKLCVHIALAEESAGIISRATGIGTIVDDDTAPVVSIDDVQVTEKDGGLPVATFTVTFSNPSTVCTPDDTLCGASVQWATVPGSATAPADFTAASGTVVMEPPDENFQYQLAYPVSVSLAGDALDELDEQFTVVLSGAKLATIGRGTGTATIVDDDAPPTAATGEASGVGADGATVAGLASPGTKATSAWFDYGPSTAYGSSTAATALPGDSTGHTLTAALSGLQFGTGYHFRLVVANATGTAFGADRTFTTRHPPATAVTGAATSVTPSAATLAGMARTYGLAGSAWFEYGPTTAYGSATQPKTLAAGSLESAVSDTLSGLAGGTTYHFRLVVRRGDEVAAGGDETFSTSRLAQAPANKPKPKPPSFSALSSGLLSGSEVRFAVRCIRAQPSCRGTIVLDAATRALSGAARPSTTRIGQAAFTRRPGGMVDVPLHIGPRAVEAVRKMRRLAVVATITVRDGVAKATRTMRLTLTIRTARRP